MNPRSNHVKVSLRCASQRYHPLPTQYPEDCLNGQWDSLVFRLIMDFFQHRYYKINKMLMSVIGQWPYQTTRASRTFLAILLFLSTSQIVPQIMAIVKYRRDWKILLECLSPLFFDAVCAAKLIGSMWNSKTMLKLLNRIRTDWQVWSRDREVTILHEYAEQGRKMTTIYTVSMYSTGILFMTQPIFPKIVDALLRNGSGHGEFPFPVDYHNLDAQKYYFYIIAYSYACVSMITMITVANDTMFIVYVQHGCGIFAALGRKLTGLGRNEGNCNWTEIGRKKASSTDGRDVEYERLISCIDRHNETIEYAALLETTYSWCFFFVMGFNMLMISVTGLQIVTRSNDPQETIRFIAFVLAQMVHLYIESYISQILMDHSIAIRYCILDGEWYRISLKSRKLLSLMTMRCNVPCKLTAGKICVMSVETFGAVLKTSMSYFTLLRSV